MGWKPASEPPDDEREVLVVVPNGTRRVARWDSAARLYHSGPSYYGVTHWRELPPPPSDRPTVRVRVAVAVMPDGTWNASGSTHCGDDDSADDVMFYDAQARARLTWIEADVPLPEPVPVETIEGEVAP